MIMETEIEAEAQSNDIKDMSFEEAMEELESIVRELESGQGALDDAISAYTRGTKLKQHCELKLKDAQTRIDKIITEPDGMISGEPLKFDN